MRPCSRGRRGEPPGTVMQRGVLARRPWVRSVEQRGTVGEVKRTPFSRWPCSVARTVDLLGDWWTPLVLREAFYGVRRFDEFQRTLGIGRNVLTQRLTRLVDEGLLERVAYCEHPPRHEYRLTDKG